MRPLVIVSVLLLVLASCGAGVTHSLADDQSGDQVLADVGDVIEFRFESNPSTGYRWEIVTTPEMIELVGDEYVAPSGERVGAPGTRMFMFDVLEEGAGILRFEYIRPFDDPPVPERVAEYMIIGGGAVWPSEPTGPPPRTSTATAGIDVGELVDGESGDVAVRGFVIWDNTSARLCEVLLESYPPQCGGASVDIADPERLGVDLEEAQGVRWTSNVVTLVGSFDGERLVLNE
jgi:predicted secreted protein